MEEQERVEQFKSDIAAMGLRDPVSGRERVLLWIGALLLIGGPVVAVLAYAQDQGTNNALQQGDDHILALVGVALTIAGAALFVRYSFGRFLRFWLARFAFEQQQQGERVAQLVEPRATERTP